MSIIHLFESVFLWEFCVIGAFVIAISGRHGAAETLARAPALDAIVAATTWLPWGYALVRGGISALLTCFLAQFLAASLVCMLHTRFHTRMRGQEASPLRKTLGGIVGPTRVVVGFWLTTLALPAFLVIRLGQVTAYPLLSFTLGFPKYRHGEWIRISRQKFEGLIGLDLLWCLYCEWAAGVYSLGGEMIRNNESFWCPIRFYDQKHCGNCRTDFPDLAQWIPLDSGKMDDVKKKLKETYTHQPADARGWYGYQRKP
ncbi:MAG: hypothetical protein AB7P04_09785 [Bacteriovoracia bacterium]